MKQPEDKASVLAICAFACAGAVAPFFFLTSGGLAIALIAVCFTLGVFCAISAKHFIDNSKGETYLAKVVSIGATILFAIELVVVATSPLLHTVLISSKSGL